MTITEAYNKGLTDAENLVIDKFSKLLNSEKVEPFNNPAMEELKNRIHRVVSPNKQKSIDIKLISKLESSIKNSPDRRNWTVLDFEDDRNDNLFKAWINIIDYHWNVSKQKHASGKVAKRILKESEEMLKDYIDIEEPETKS